MDVLDDHSSVRLDDVSEVVESFLRANYVSLQLHSAIDLISVASAFTKEQESVFKHVVELNICEARRSSLEYGIALEDIVSLDLCAMAIHMYSISGESATTGETEDANEGYDDSMQSSMATHWDLPCASLEGLWNTLVFDDELHLRLLDYVYTALLFSDKGVDPNIIGVNRVVLLYGPPGTGKTTLCRALAQKIAIRLSDRYTYGKLVELNAHAVFSKYFSESSKLVMQLFQNLHELLNDDDTFVCVLMDEVESLTAARKSVASGLEPSDALRVVNALLTQLDRLRRRRNVLVMATSNITEAIDVAFIDRADIKQFVGEPSEKAAYVILSTCLKELMAKGIIRPLERLLSLNELDLLESPASKRLFELCSKCRGMSGRTLRKLPFLAHSNYIQVCLGIIHHATIF